MVLEIANIVIAFGLVVLIWSVQLLIYPSFKYYTKNNLYTWHKKYTILMSVLVIPLMLSQLIIAAIALLKTGSFILYIHFTLVCLTWISTLLIFVPLHNVISNQNATKNTLKKLVKLNWLRVILWSFIFIISILNL
ncbi:hypothetical protein [Lacinutrix sp.]|uniref:hypothetical protein n=1 Tax=Lacinutrix sp. TaxID=1937692 RepID=UPI0025C2EE94|nr:hypothetical protein [Lacinutrix sp.]